jgi:hypothetical protein
MRRIHPQPQDFAELLGLVVNMLGPNKHSAVDLQYGPTVFNLQKPAKHSIQAG